MREYSGESKKTAFTPHTITVEKDGKTAEKTVMADRQQEIEVKL